MCFYAYLHVRGLIFETASIACILVVFFFLMIRRPPRSTLDRSSAASDVYKRQAHRCGAEQHADEDENENGQATMNGWHGYESFLFCIEQRVTVRRQAV